MDVIIQYLIRTPFSLCEKGVQKKSIRASVFFVEKIEDFFNKKYARPKKNF